MYHLKVFLPICHTDYKGAEDRKEYDNTDWEQGPRLLDKWFLESIDEGSPCPTSPQKMKSADFVIQTK